MASQRRKDAALDLMIRARGILNVDDDAVVSVSEHDCGDPDCRGARTVSLRGRRAHGAIPDEVMASRISSFNSRPA
jgi:hypothetical protein